MTTIAEQIVENERVAATLTELAAGCRESYEAGLTDRAAYTQCLIDLGIYWRREPPPPEPEPSVPQQLVGWVLVALFGTLAFGGVMLFFTVFQLGAGYEWSRTILGRLFS